MKIDTEGTYTLRYTAVDSCGNESTEEREVVVGSPRTVVYEDHTLIFNEQPKDRATNIALHGEAEFTCDAMLEDGSNYVFASASQVPWLNTYGKTAYSISFGEEMKPVSMAYWFSGITTAQDWDFSNLDTSLVTDMTSTFEIASTAVSPSLNFDLSSFDTSNVTTMRSMFKNTNFASIDVSSFDTSKVTDMSDMFYGVANTPSLDLSGWDVSNVTTMNQMFCAQNGSRDTTLTMVDLSGWDTSSLTDTAFMFYYRAGITTIYASPTFVTDNITNSSAMFQYCSQIVGGAGTTYTSSRTDKRYARIDNPPSAPGYFTAKS